MRRQLLPLVALAAMTALPASAGELGVLVDKQVGKAQVASFSGQKYDAVSPTGFALRGGFDLLDLKVAALQLNATWHNKTTGGSPTAASASRARLRGEKGAPPASLFRMMSPLTPRDDGTQGPGLQRRGGRG